MFGVFIRSIGERTERLCWESCASEILSENIIIIRNRYPAYEAYLEMFEAANRIGYDWFLGIDADVVLIPGWYNNAVQLRNEIEDGGWFVFSCAVEDRFLGRIDRGNHFYNGRHVGEALDILRGKTKHMLKPESSICRYISYRDPHFDNDLIGFHGFEQYYCDIFYRFWLQSKRMSDLEEIYPFLRGDKENWDNNLDFTIAREGWKAGRGNWLMRWLRSKLPYLPNAGRSDASLREKLYTGRVGRREEKSSLKITFEKFLEERGEAT